MEEVDNKQQIKKIQAQIIVLSRMRDAVRQVSPKIFQRSDNEDTKTIFNRRDMVYEAILEALEDLEDQLEDQLDIDLDEDEEEEKKE